MTDSFDTLVIGGGPAGSTAALLLANAGWRVVRIWESEAKADLGSCVERITGEVIARSVAARRDLDLRQE